MNDELHPTLQQFLQEQSTLALATVNDQGEPEVAPLFYVSDERHNLYWLSNPTVRHSRNLAVRPQVAAAIYPIVWQWNDIAGVQIEGRAEAIADDRIREQIMVLYLRKFLLPASFDAAIAASTLYVLRPRWIRWIDNSVQFGYKSEFTLED
jgi:uncharacterized protein YhbP (UPF0306 family)